MKNFMITAACLMLIKAQTTAATLEGEQNTDGSFKKWHRITLTFDGPDAQENSATFRNYRLDVTLTSPSGKVFLVPGFFAADGNAAESGATSGTKWRTRFPAGEEGVWSYSVSFVSGSDVAAELTGGSPAGAPHGETGNFTVGSTDKTGRDFRGRGKLEYTGEHYLRFAETGEYFFKAGPDSPELFLEFNEFDNTNTSRTYSQHIKHWNDGDPSWKNGLGKAIIGAVNYLSDYGMNVHYFMLMNSFGDGTNAYPWTGNSNIDIYDISKLAQWEIVFQHFDVKGMMLHFVLSETENASLFEIMEGGGSFSPARKIFYREMVARFGHHLAITWNIGEENQWETNVQYGAAISDDQRKKFSTWIRELTYYPDHISVHNGPSGNTSLFPPLIGHPDFTGPSLQMGFGNTEESRAAIVTFREDSEAANHKWVVSLDEPWENNTSHTDGLRENVVWGSITAGAAGVEWYIGGQDLALTDGYEQYTQQWEILGHAAEIMNNHIPFSNMTSNDNLVTGTENWAMGDDGYAYLIYLKNGGLADLNLIGQDGTFEVTWFNPRTGEGPLIGAVTTVQGGSQVSLGNPPSNTNQDWVVSVTKDEPISSAQVNKNSTSDVTAAYGNGMPLFSDQHEEGITFGLYDIAGRAILSGTPIITTCINLGKGLYLLKFTLRKEPYIVKLLVQ